MRKKINYQINARFIMKKIQKNFYKIKIIDIRNLKKNLDPMLI